MRTRAMHPLCCIRVDCPCGGGSGIDEHSPSPSPSLSVRDRMDAEEEEIRRKRPPRKANAAGRGLEEVTTGSVVFAGVLHKWTNYGKGWRSRWFSLKNGVLSYSKVRVDGDDVRYGDSCDDVRLIGGSRIGERRGRRKQANGQVGAGVVHLKISSFRESRSDDKRFYVFSTTKTLQLKTDSKKTRAAWIEALLSSRCKYPPRTLSEQLSFIHNDESFSTEKLRKRLLDEGVNESIVKDCERIMRSEFSLFEERLSLLALRRQLEEVNVDTENDGIQESQLLIKSGFSSSDHGKYSEYSTTESSDDVEKQEVDELSDEDGLSSYFDANEFLLDSSIDCNPIGSIVDAAVSRSMEENKTDFSLYKLTKVERRKRLPTPIEKEKGVSLWSMIKDNVGKDLTRVCLPVYFNEPLSSLQKCFEDLEYSHLLDQAYEHGKKGNSLMRILNVAAFAVSGYASSEGRLCKPFNPMLGETYEADYPEKGLRFFSEKVSHHPMSIACHCEGRCWKFWGDSNLRSKFWGRSIQLDPIGVITLEFDDGEIFQWSKVTTSIYNLILGKVYCDHHGTMSIKGNRGYSCTLKFKEQSLLDRNPHQVQGYVENVNGVKVATLMGKWDDSMYYTEGYDVSQKFHYLMKNSSLLWRKNIAPDNPTRYNLTSFAITLNELTSELEEKLPPTDSRRRPDQRHLENGEYEKANAEKLRLEQRQRMSRKLQEDGWKPRWFNRDSENSTYHYVGGYWQARELKQWEGCPDVFGDLSNTPSMTDGVSSIKLHQFKSV